MVECSVGAHSRAPGAVFMNTPVTVFTMNLPLQRIKGTPVIGTREQIVTVAGVRRHANVASGTCRLRQNGDMEKSLTDTRKWWHIW